MQIKSIILYNTLGQKRVLSFKLGSVNIIRGKSNTGKSALIQIIEYCLGRSEFEIPGKIIRDSVTWYAVLYQLRDRQLFIAKPTPSNGGTKYTRVYYQVSEDGSEILPPDLSKSMLNATDTELVRIITQQIRQSLGYDITDDDEQTTLSGITVSNASYYLFQDQDTINNRHKLFYRQQEPRISKIIKNTVRYFLGIEPENNQRLKNNLAQAQSNLRQAKKELNGIENKVSDLMTLGQDLINQAKSAGLLSKNFTLKYETDLNEISRTLKEISSAWVPSIITPVSDDRLPQLRQELREIELGFYQKNEKIQNLELYRREIAGYSKEVDRQKTRLDSINLFTIQDMIDELDEAHICPLCLSNIPESSANVPKVSEIRKSYTQLEVAENSVERQVPILSEEINKQKEELEQIRGEIRRKQMQIEDVLREQKASENVVQRIRDANSRIDRIIGGIELYLNMVRSIENRTILKQNTEVAERRVEKCKEELDKVLLDNNERRIMLQMSDQMTEWANQLNLSNGRYSLDLNKLTVVVDEKERSFFMKELGGKDYLGCHLITLLALHKHFVENKRTVPNFLVLDQPAQGFFTTPEAEKAYKTMGAERDETQNVTNYDTIEMQKTFKLIFDVCEILSPNLQIIILEHANLSDDRFQNALLEECPWTDDNALIPKKWLVSVDQLSMF